MPCRAESSRRLADQRIDAYPVVRRRKRRALPINTGRLQISGLVRSQTETIAVRVYPRAHFLPRKNAAAWPVDGGKPPGP